MYRLILVSCFCSEFIEPNIELPSQSSHFNHSSQKSFFFLFLLRFHKLAAETRHQHTNISSLETPTKRDLISSLKGGKYFVATSLPMHFDLNTPTNSLDVRYVHFWFPQKLVCHRYWTICKIFNDRCCYSVLPHVMPEVTWSLFFCTCDVNSTMIERRSSSYLATGLVKFWMNCVTSYKRIFWLGWSTW